MSEDIKKLSEEVAKMEATIIDMILAWCKETGHNPYFILGIIGQRLYYHSKNSDFNEYKPTYGGIIRQMDNETLAQQIYDLADAVKTIRLPEREAVRKIFNVLESNFDEECKI